MGFWTQKKIEKQQRKAPATEVVPIMHGNAKRRKPQDRTKLTRNHQVQIRLTEQEKTTLKSAARNSEMSLADFVLAGAHQSRRIVVPGAGELRTEVLCVGKSLNQALKLAHCARKEGYRIDVASIQTATEKAEEVIDKMDNFITKWDVDLTHQNKKGENENADFEM